ncbi:unnamed protein product [Notodromas monacha]|uniref:GH18 domain-containing protein n=1 Tax=Notodromas monacha TaxID=399045 RepID=A0A7R9BC85_9CRUS|nr:unnamed protein product [Notodromas monacha]CAG0912611.1 unnamed protein product [Notodromas monacha]
MQSVVLCVVVLKCVVASCGAAKVSPFTDDARNPFALKSSHSSRSDGSDLIVCYLTGSPAFWNKNAAGVVEPKDIPDDTCNTLNLMNWLGIRGDRLSWSNDFNWQVSLKQVIHEWRDRNTSWPYNKDGSRAKRIMVTIGDAGQLRNLVRSAELDQGLLRRFAVNVRTFLAWTGLDGLDIDWEYPGWHRPWQERPMFLALLAELRKEFDTALPPLSRRLYISVAAAASRGIMESAYIMPDMGKYVDWINLMAYDYHGFVWYMPFTGHNAPLEAAKNENGTFSELNVHWSVQRWLDWGLPKEKLVLGIPTYGRSFRLVRPEVHDIGSPALGGGWTNFTDACSILNSADGVRVWDSDSQVPYTYRNGTRDWISYDDEESVAKKVQFSREFQLGGVMVFSLDADDHEGVVCSVGRKNKKKFPLLRRIVAEMRKTF